MQQWNEQNMGIHWVVLMVNDPGKATPATSVGAKAWKEEHGLTSVTVIPDNNYSMIPPGTGMFGTPTFTIVNPRDMSVFAVVSGGGGQHDAKLIELANMNKLAAEGGAI